MLAIGDPAPNFTLQDQHGQPVTLSDFAGRQSVILFFYPFAFSRVCTSELHEIRDNLGDLNSETSLLLAVSCDHMFSLRAYAEQDQLDFPLLSDFWPHGRVSREYGFFNEQLGCSRRATCIIDRAGVVRWLVENAMPQARNLAEYRVVLEGLDTETAP